MVTSYFVSYMHIDSLYLVPQQFCELVKVDFTVMQKIIPYTVPPTPEFTI